MSAHSEAGGGHTKVDCYDYVRRFYGVDPKIGGRAKHTITGRAGIIVRKRSGDQYVHVRFDGQKHSLPCHPTELDYEP